MTILFYDKKNHIALSENLFFPKEEDIIEEKYVDKDYISVNEWQPYYVKFYKEKTSEFFKNVPFYVKEFPERIYEINYKNYVGLSRIGDIYLHVENKKITDDIYDAMLEYITSKYSDLIFSFNKSVGLEYKKVKVGKDIPFIQYLFLKKYLLDQKPGIKEITGIILSAPHRKIQTETQKCLIEEIDHFDTSLVIDLLSNPDKMTVLRSGHSLLSTPLGSAIFKRTGNNYYPSETKKIRKYYTFDTNENRFIKYFLNEILRELDLLESARGSKYGTYLNPDISLNIEELTQQIKYLLSDPIWSEVGRMTFIPLQSTVLQRREGYRHLFRLYSLLQLITRYQFLMEDFRNLIETKDVPTLFEYWCFFLVKDILDTNLKPLNYSVIVPPADTEKMIQEGIQVEYDGNVSLLYNPTFSGSPGVSAELLDISNYQTSASYSHNLRPDIVITKNDGEKLILDAKYKGKKGDSGFYGEESSGTISNYKEEDLDKMHTYREAIKNVYGAFALYPGNKTAIYPSHQAARQYEGVGALPLKPMSGGKPNPEHIENIEKVIIDFLSI